MLNAEYKQVIQKNKIGDYDSRVGFKYRNKCLHLQKFILKKTRQTISLYHEGQG